MAVTVVQETAGTTGATAPSSYPVVLSNPTASGNMVLIVVVSDATVTTPSGFTVDRSQVNSNGHYHFSKISSGGETTFTTSPTVSAAGTWYVAEISGLTATPLDQATSTGSSTAATTRSTGTTGTTVQADEFAVASWGSSQVGTAATFGAQTQGFVERVADQVTTTGGSNVGMSVASKVLSSTGTVESTATVDGGGSAKSTGIVTTYKAAAGGSTVNADGSLAVTATRTGAAAVDRPASGASVATVALAGTAAVDRAGSGSTSVSVALSAAATVTHNASGSLTVTATLVAASDQTTTVGQLTGTTGRTGGPSI